MPFGRWLAKAIAPAARPIVNVATIVLGRAQDASDFYDAVVTFIGDEDVASGQ